MIVRLVQGRSNGGHSEPLESANRRADLQAATPCGDTLARPAAKRSTIPHALKRLGDGPAAVCNCDAGSHIRETLIRALTDQVDMCGSVAWSPDGRWVVAGGSEEAGTPGLYKIPADGGPPELWLPGGQRIAYTQNQPDGGALFVRRLDAAGGERQVYQANCPQVLTSLTPDGRRALVSDFGPREGRMRLVNLDGVADIQELPSDAGEIDYDASGMISPDGRWIAYVSNRTRREEVYVRSLGARLPGL